MTWIVNDASEIVWRASGTHSNGKSQKEGSSGWKDNSKDKKIGAKSSDPNRYSQPRLPGSVVGEASMPRTRNCYKITKVSVLK